jgi:uncharacterized protein YodC (DUF2158 family)
MTNSLFKVGDHVRLKNDKNSPNMTVENVKQDNNKNVYDCTWFNSPTQSYRQDTFVEEVLELVTDSAVKALPATEQNKLNSAKNNVLALHNAALDMERQNPNSRLNIVRNKTGLNIRGY